MNESQLITSLRKSGQLEEAYQRAQQAIQNAPTDLWLRRAMGWVLYDLLKRILGAVKDGEEDGSTQTAGQVDLRRVHKYFAEYRQLELPREDALIHSQMLRLAAKAQRAGWWGFIEFVQWWGLENLTADDRKAGQSSDGRALPSLEQSVLYALGRAALQTEQPEIWQWVSEILAEAQARYPDDLWIIRSIALLNLKLGNEEQARQRTVAVLRRKPREWWLWKEMGEMLERANPEDAIMCYYRACELMRDKPKLVSVYQKLAQLLASQARYEEAAWFVEQAYKHRAQQGWKIPLELSQLRQTDWFQRHANAPQPQVQTEPFARRFLSGISADTLQRTQAVIDHHNTDKQITYLLITPREGITAPHREFPHLQRLPVGTVVEVAYAGSDGRKVVVECQAASVQEIEGLVRRVRGSFRKRPEQNFGFIQADTNERYFVPPALASQLSNNTVVDAVCVLKHNEKRGQDNWVAVRVETV